MYSQKWISKLTIKIRGNYSEAGLNSNYSNQYQLLTKKKGEPTIAYINLIFIFFIGSLVPFFNSPYYPCLTQQIGTGEYLL